MATQTESRSFTGQDIVSGPFGGPGGEHYSERGENLTEFHAWGTSRDGFFVVSAIQFFWDGKPGRIVGTPDDNHYKSIRFNHDERIKNMTIHAGHEQGYVDNITFETNQGHKFEVGGNGGEVHPINVGSGHWLGADGGDDFGGLRGAKGVVDRIRVYFR
ncbi:hypothetical protein ASPWEDRAFT_40579 [Aspergillus wentii DTO 134E9]|uniref:Jacalin-type lectin domain-containing protein n=1 Tax=Aspergillus wentii DTO 134E9 TaxID=1073089 RepID=A0A1L9RKE2_ASPWE|nr:uncharacterized protein ASPWEDRAFT_40579 [Aspergillus wentii DTO 134E9]KAI9924845.1 hypothetical protein MW887_006702 [Aspergillus wentii]OJJ35381.1 hypothetical protein ASPWEDRAFT_40579 [Aspergillus wentii DTO 134E9]